MEDQNVTYANEAFREISGYSFEEIENMSFIPEEDRADLLGRRQRRMDTGEGDTNYETGLRRKDGQRVDVEVAFKVFEGENPPRFMVIVRDITERKKIEQELTESEERYRAVIEQAAKGIILIDVDDHHILEANPEFRRLFGYSAEEVVGLTIYDLDAHDRESVDLNIELTLEEEDRTVGTRRYRRKDGSLVDIMVSGSAISYGGRRVLSLVIRDITERKRAEEALRQSER